MKEKTRKLFAVIVPIVVFWIFDFVMHEIGVGESNYYFLSKFGNALLFSIMWVFIFRSKSQMRKIIYSVIFGTWISFYYLISAYSGIVQNFFGIVARYSAPPFVIFGLYLSPVFWWVFHIIAFYAGLEIADILLKAKQIKK